jgi:hypothetical protein
MHLSPGRGLTPPQGFVSRSDALGELAAALGVDARDLEVALPSPVRTVTYGEELEMDLGSAVRFQCGEPALAVIEVRPESVTVAEASIRWNGHVPVLELGEVHAVNSFSSDIEALRSAVQAAATARQATFETCALCGRHLPPEHLTDVDDESVCHGCATKHHGVLF